MATAQMDWNSMLRRRPLRAGEYYAYATRPGSSPGAAEGGMYTNVPGLARDTFLPQLPLRDVGPTPTPKAATAGVPMQRPQTVNAAWITGQPAQAPAAGGGMPMADVYRSMRFRSGAGSAAERQKYAQDMAAREAAGRESPEERKMRHERELQELRNQGQAGVAEIGAGARTRAAELTAETARANVQAQIDADVQRRVASGESVFMPDGKTLNPASRQRMTDALEMERRKAEIAENNEMAVAYYRARLEMAGKSGETTTTETFTDQSGAEVPDIKATRRTATTTTTPGELPAPPIADDADGNGVPDAARWTDPGSGEQHDMNKIVNFLKLYERLAENDPKKREWAAQYEIDRKRKAAWLASIGKPAEG